MSDRTRADLVRSIALAASAAAVVGVPTLGPQLLGTTENTERYDTAVTPPGYAFAVWAPIFAGIVANAAQAALPGRRRLPENRVTGWPLVGAYALNTAWSVASQSDRFALTPFLLPAATALSGLAFRRLQSEDDGRETVTSVSTGLLLGWTSLASVVNISAGTQLLGADATSRRSVVLSTVGAAAAGTALAGAITQSQRGYLPLAAAATWGLVTTALDSKRSVTARVGTALAAAAIVGAAAVTYRRQRARAAPSGTGSARSARSG